jgi:RNA recognition motif-containing protein
MLFGIHLKQLSRKINIKPVVYTVEAFGQVASVAVVRDKQSGRSKGFGFVEMPVQTEAQSAIKVLTGKALKGRTITVNEARRHSGQPKR